jgi:hypothetical protein
MISTRIGELPNDLWDLLDLEQPSPVQRTPDNIDRASGLTPKAQATVHTDIGDLPADLWGLIDRKVPTVQASPETLHRAIARAEASPYTSTTSTADSALWQDTSQMDSTTSEPYEFPTLVAPHPDAADVVQASSSAIVEGDDWGERDRQEESEIDMNDLAQKVFNEIRRRIRIEWERNRGQF